MKNKKITIAGALSAAALIGLSLLRPSESDVARVNQQILARQASNTPSNTRFQSEVASKAKWPTIKTTDNRVRSAFLATDASRVRSLINQRASFEGIVQSIGVTPGNSLSMINFGVKSSGALLVVLKSDNYSAFPPISQLEGQRVLVEGNVVLFTNKRGEEFVEIILADPKQLSLVKD